MCRDAELRIEGAPAGKPLAGRATVSPRCRLKPGPADQRPWTPVPKADENLPFRAVLKGICLFEHQNEEQEGLRRNLLEVFSGEKPLKMSVESFPTDPAVIESTIALQKKVRAAFTDGALNITAKD